MSDVHKNTSATGGYLAPGPAPVPQDDPELTRVFQQMVVGITALPGKLVRPRWQAVPPAQPEASVDWCAVGVSHISGDFDAVITHKPHGHAVPTEQDGHDGQRALGSLGESLLTRNEELEVLCSFYGPHRIGYATLLRDGLALSQNRAVLRRAGIVLGFVGTIRPAPAFIHQQWVQKADVPLTLRREVRRVYPVLTFTRLPAGVCLDTGFCNNLGCAPEEV